MTDAKPTPGPWDIGTQGTDFEGSVFVPIDSKTHSQLALVYLTHQTQHPMWGITNARLIAEAGTVYHETGLTPRQLAEQRAELLEALEECRSVFKTMADFPGGFRKTVRETLERTTATIATARASEREGGAS